MTGQKLANQYFQNKMTINKDSTKELVIQYLKKNNNFFLDNPDLLEEINLPVKQKNSNKIVDLNAYRSNKIEKEYERLKNQLSEILKAGSSHIVSQKRILKTSLKILNTKSLSKLIDVIVNDLGIGVAVITSW